jgi:hypothetical protein
MKTKSESRLANLLQIEGMLTKTSPELINKKKAARRKIGRAAFLARWEIFKTGEKKTARRFGLALTAFKATFKP